MSTPPEEPAVPFLSKIKEFLLGDEKNPLDSRVFHTGSLIAVLAWVGMGADGLSSSCYGPEDAYLALGPHTCLTLPLALFMVLAVFMISASYTQIIELFASGGAGGGYLVATRFLGSGAGVVSGAALVVDYILTIAVSVAASEEAFFSFVPLAWHGAKIYVAMGFLVLLLILNLRGLKESVTALTPIFLIFVLTHLAAILTGIFGNLPRAHDLLLANTSATSDMLGSVGMWGTVFVLMRAFSLGGGTYTGIEAVSNGLAILREPRAETGKRTMTYMAFSLAFTASGLLLCYALNDIRHEPGLTLNASLLNHMWSGLVVGHVAVGRGLVVLALVSEAALLIVAAQSGFIGGPQVLASMAADFWVPRRLSNLSDRLVNQDGIVMMAGAAGLVLYFTHANVNTIVVMYSINVFITFTLSQLGMCRHWLEVRGTGARWVKPLVINGTGLVLTTWILVFTSVVKLKEGGWATLVMTAGMVAGCVLVKNHYLVVRQQLKKLDDLLTTLKFHSIKQKVTRKNPAAPTAILMVNGYNGLGIHTMFSILKLFPDRFKNFLFVEVGTIDSSRFKGLDAIQALEANVKNDLERYVELARNLGFYSEQRYGLNVDRLEALERLCGEIAGEFKDTVFFVGKLVFEHETWTSALLHSQTSLSIQKKLLFDGHQVIVMPIRLRG